MTFPADKIVYGYFIFVVICVIYFFVGLFICGLFNDDVSSSD